MFFVFLKSTVYHIFQNFTFLIVSSPFSWVLLIPVFSRYLSLCSGHSVCCFEVCHFTCDSSPSWPGRKARLNLDSLFPHYPEPCHQKASNNPTSPAPCNLGERIIRVTVKVKCYPYLSASCASELM